MSISENEGLDLSNDAVVDQLIDNLDNAEIADLPLGSPEQKAALANAGKTEQESADLDEEQNSVETTEDELEVDETDDEDELEQVRKPKKGVQKRFDEMTRRIKELESKLQPAQQEAPQEEVIPKFEKAAPKAFEFENLEDFYRADADWRHEKAEFERGAVEAKSSQEKWIKDTADTWNTRADDFKKNVADYDDYVNQANFAKLNTSQSALKYALKLENGPNVVYNLMKDPAKVEAFKSGDEADQIAMLTEIKLGLKSQPTATVSSAPEPPRKLPKSPGVSKTVYRDDMSDAEFDKLLNAEIKKSRRR